MSEVSSDLTGQATFVVPKPLSTPRYSNVPRIASFPEEFVGHGFSRPHAVSNFLSKVTPLVGRNFFWIYHKSSLTIYLTPECNAEDGQDIEECEIMCVLDFSPFGDYINCCVEVDFENSFFCPNKYLVVGINNFLCLVDVQAGCIQKTWRIDSILDLSLLNNDNDKISSSKNLNEENVKPECSISHIEQIRGSISFSQTEFKNPLLIGTTCGHVFLFNIDETPLKNHEIETHNVTANELIAPADDESVTSISVFFLTSSLTLFLIGKSKGTLQIFSIEKQEMLSPKTASPANASTFNVAQSILLQKKKPSISIADKDFESDQQTKTNANWICSTRTIKMVNSQPITKIVGQKVQYGESFLFFFWVCQDFSILKNQNLAKISLYKYISKTSAKKPSSASFNVAPPSPSVSSNDPSILESNAFEIVPCISKYLTPGFVNPQKITEEEIRFFRNNVVSHLVSAQEFREEQEENPTKMLIIYETYCRLNEKEQQSFAFQKKKTISEVFDLVNYLSNETEIIFLKDFIRSREQLLMLQKTGTFIEYPMPISQNDDEISFLEDRILGFELDLDSIETTKTSSDQTTKLNKDLSYFKILLMTEDSIFGIHFKSNQIDNIIRKINTLFAKSTQILSSGMEVDDEDHFSILDSLWDHSRSRLINQILQKKTASRGSGFLAPNRVEPSRQKFSVEHLSVYEPKEMSVFASTQDDEEMQESEEDFEDEYMLKNPSIVLDWVKLKIKSTFQTIHQIIATLLRENEQKQGKLLERPKKIAFRQTISDAARDTKQMLFILEALHSRIHSRNKEALKMLSNLFQICKQQINFYECFDYVLGMGFLFPTSTASDPQQQTQPGASALSYFSDEKSFSVLGKNWERKKQSFSSIMKLTNTQKQRSPFILQLLSSCFEDSASNISELDSIYPPKRIGELSHLFLCDSLEDFIKMSSKELDYSDFAEKLKQRIEKNEFPSSFDGEDSQNKKNMLKHLCVLYFLTDFQENVMTPMEEEAQNQTNSSNLPQNSSKNVIPVSVYADVFRITEEYQNFVYGLWVLDNCWNLYDFPNEEMNSNLKTERNLKLKENLNHAAHFLMTCGSTIWDSLIPNSIEQSILEFFESLFKDHDNALKLIKFREVFCANPQKILKNFGFLELKVKILCAKSLFVDCFALISKFETESNQNKEKLFEFVLENVQNCENKDKIQQFFEFPFSKNEKESIKKILLNSKIVGSKKLLLAFLMLRGQYEEVLQFLSLINNNNNEEFETQQEIEEIKKMKPAIIEKLTRLNVVPQK